MSFLLDLANPWGYILIFLLGVAEGAALVGLLLPGETAMLLGGVLVYQGRATLSVMLLAGCLGAVVGDSVGYWIGRRFGGKLRGSRLGQRVGEERWRRAGSYLSERGAKAVFLGRFLGFLRTLIPPVAGSAAMPYRRFVAFNAPAGILWAAAFILLGVGLGGTWRAVDAWAGRATVVLLILVGFGLIVFLAARWVQRREALLLNKWRAFLNHETVKHLRHRFRPQLEFMRRRLEPEGRFGIYLTVGLGIALLSAAAFGAVLDSLAERGDIAQLDALVLDFFSQHRVSRLDRVMETVARAGGVVWTAGGIVLAVTAGFIMTRDCRLLVFGGLVLLGALLLDDAVGSFLDVVGIRPVRVPETVRVAFPSPQATAGGAFVAVVAYVAGRTKSWRASVWGGALALLAAFFVVTALLYLGKETPSAVLAGFLLGLFWAAVSATSSNQLRVLWKASR